MHADRLSIAYSEALERYLQEAGEDALHTAYEIGRDAVAGRLSIVELARLHHGALEEVLVGRGTVDHGHILRAGGDFLSETLSAFEIVRLGYEEARDLAVVERQHATLVRRLSALLADTSLAIEGEASLAEILQLVVEGACELTTASGSVAIVRTDGVDRVAAVSGLATEQSQAQCVVPLTALDGRFLGTLAIVYAENQRSELDEAVLAHLGQMVAATIERATRYGRTSR